MQQLNVIVTLKAFGMTSTQIRVLLETKRPPGVDTPLARALEIQLQACIARRDAAKKSFALVKAALATIESGKSLEHRRFKAFMGLRHCA